ncbi:hypothetical protein C8J56DRAFT_946399, partial [Mycena floridula]
GNRKPMTQRLRTYSRMSIHPATVHLHPGAIAMAFLSSVFLQSKVIPKMHRLYWSPCCRGSSFCASSLSPTFTRKTAPSRTTDGLHNAEDMLESRSAALAHSWFPLTHVIAETTFRIFRRAPVDPAPSFRQVRLGGWLAKFYRRTSSKTK